MKNLFYPFLIVLLGVLSCNINDPEPTIDWENHLDSAAFYEAFIENENENIEKYLHGEWEIVKVYSSYFGETTKENLTTNGTYLFNDDGTFLKTVVEDDETYQVSGTYAFNCSIANGYSGYDVRYGFKCLTLKRALGSDDPILGNCYSDLKWEVIWINTSGQIVKRCSFEPDEGYSDAFYEKKNSDGTLPDLD